MKILFLCVANSARSQMAEGLAQKIFGPSVEIQSAGSEPSGKVNPYAIQALKEIGIDISHHQSKSWKDLPPNFLTNLQYVITLCAEEICPTLPVKTKRLHWALPDPGQHIEVFRKTRDEIKQRIERFKNDLVSSKLNDD